MSEKLKPCPFCGSEAMLYTKLTLLEDEGNFDSPEILKKCKKRYAIRCSSCGCGTPLYPFLEGINVAWNSRMDND